MAVFPPGFLALVSSWLAQSSPTVPGDVVFTSVVAAQKVLRGSPALVPPLAVILAVISSPLPLAEPPAGPLNPFPVLKLVPPANNEPAPSPELVDEAGGQSLHVTGVSSQVPGSCAPGEWSS